MRVRFKLIGVLMLLVMASPVAQAQQFSWGLSIGGPGTEIPLDIGVDDQGDVYVVGQFDDVVDFDPGAGVFDLAAAGSTDAFVAKYDNDGVFAWARRLGGEGADVPWAIAVDSWGNVVTVGEFEGTVDFDPGPDTLNLTGPELGRGVFVWKLDAAGDLLWARELETSASPSSAVAHGVALDDSGNVYAVGTLFRTADFDPGPGTFNLTSTRTDVFVWKLDDAGGFVWARQLGVDENAFGWDVALDRDGNPHVFGEYYDDVEGSDVFVAKLDNNGTLVWTSVAFSSHWWIWAEEVELDDAGNIYTVGDFAGTTDFDPGPGTFNLTTEADSGASFVWKLDSTGELAWVQSYDRTDTLTYLTSIAFGGSMGLYTGGGFLGVADVDPGDDSHMLNSVGEADAFVSNFDSSGGFSWARQIAGLSGEATRHIAAHSNGSLYATGAYQSAVVDLDPGPDTFDVPCLGNLDAFVVKLLPDSEVMVTGLSDRVLDLALHAGTTGSLQAKLNAASKHLGDSNDDNDNASINALQAFINAVQAQSGNHIPESDADALIEYAQNIMSVMLGGE